MNPTLHRGRARLLAAETLWLMRLRWVAGVFIVALGATHWALVPMYAAQVEPLLLGVFVLAYNAALAWFLRSRPITSLSFRVLIGFASVQIHLDLLCLILLKLWTGGLYSQKLAGFFFHMIFVALLQPRGLAYLLGTATVLGLALGLWLTSQWPTHPTDVERGLAWVAAMLGTVYLAERVAHSLYIREIARIRQSTRNRTLTKALRAQHDALVQSEKLSAMGTLAAGIAHEITNPLASMDSVLQLMQRAPDKPQPDAVLTLREQVQRILRIIRQLTSFAHAGRGSVAPVGVNELAASALELLELGRSLEHVTIDRAFDANAGIVSVDAHAMQQVLANLLVNALDATSQVPTPTIRMATRSELGHGVIEVSDNGHGIDPQHLPRIFEPFFTTKPVGKGTGLGLSICARLVREQQGRIDVDSSPGRGARFVVRLPSSGSP